MKMSEDLDESLEDSLKKIFAIRATIIKKATDEGIEMQKFSLYFDKLIIKIFTELAKESNWLQRRFTFKPLNTKLKGIILLILIMLFLLGMSVLTNENGIKDKITGYFIEYNSMSVDQYLEKNKFQEAMEAANKSDFPNKRKLEVFQAEITYWINKNQLDIALIKFNEMMTIQVTEDCSEDKDLCEQTKNISINKNCLNLVQAYCVNGDFEKARKIVLKFPEKVVTNIRNEYISYGTGDGEHSNVDICRKTYNAIKKGLQQNQEIEPFKESQSDDYKITTYEHPQNEALKIIEGFETLKK